MKVLRKISLMLLCLAVAGGALSGCGDSGPPRAKIKGEVTNDGEPLKVKPMVGKVQVTFFPLSEKGEITGDPQEAAIQPSGEFTVHGTEGKGILPGKYKIAVRQWDEFPNKDVLEGKADKDHTTIIRDIKDGDEVIIDVKDILAGKAK